MSQNLHRIETPFRVRAVDARDASTQAPPKLADSERYCPQRSDPDPFAYAAPFEELLLRPPTELTSDELAACASLIEVMEQRRGPASPSLRRWARLGNEVWFLAMTTGRMPLPGDEGARPRHFRWIANQHRNRLNAFERAFVESMPGWVYPERLPIEDGHNDVEQIG